MLSCVSLQAIALESDRACIALPVALRPPDESGGSGSVDSRLMAMWPSVERTGPPRAPGDERISLETWLDYHRATLLMKCAGLEPEQLATRSCPPSSLSLLGLVRHMTEVETWFHDFDGQPHGHWYCTDDDPDGEFDSVDPARATEDLAAYHVSVGRARAAIEGHGLDDLAPGAAEPISLRWVFQHMIEEYARHNGHADLLRERIDGAVGD
jgi:hypothetical protein